MNLIAGKSAILSVYLEDANHAALTVSAATVLGVLEVSINGGAALAGSALTDLISITTAGDGFYDIAIANTLSAYDRLLIKLDGADLSGSSSFSFSEVVQQDLLVYVPDAVWNSAISPSRTLSELPAGSATSAKQDTLAAAIAGVPAAVWLAGGRTLSSFGTLVADVWAAGSRTLTSVAGLGIATEANQTTLASAVAGVPAAVWAASGRTLSSFGTLVADIATAVWGAASRTLSAITGLGIATEAKQDTIIAAIPASTVEFTVSNYVYDSANRPTSARKLYADGTKVLVSITYSATGISLYSEEIVEEWPA